MPPRKSRDLKTDQTHDTIIAWLEQGSTDEVACHMAGVATRTFYSWLEIGNAIIDGGYHERIPKQKAKREWLVRFVQGVTRANAKARAGDELSLTRAARGATTKDVTEHVFEETRVNPHDGKIYVHREVRTTTRTTEHPPNVKALDMRLSRRYPKDWSPAVQRTANLNVDLTEEMREQLADMGLNADDFANEVLAEATRLLNASNTGTE